MIPTKTHPLRAKENLNRDVVSNKNTLRKRSKSTGKLDQSQKSTARMQTKHSRGLLARFPLVELKDCAALQAMKEEAIRKNCPQITLLPIQIYSERGEPLSASNTDIKRILTNTISKQGQTYR